MHLKRFCGNKKQNKKQYRNSFTGSKKKKLYIPFEEKVWEAFA